MGVSVFAFILSGSAMLWWTVKRESVRHDWPLAWDVADLAGGFIAGVVYFVLVRPLVVFDPAHGVTANPDLFMFRSSVVFAFGAFLGFWVSSMYVEQETERELPASLDPLEERVYEMQLGWVPFAGPRK